MVQYRSLLPYATFLLVGFLGLFSDYLTKEWALANLETGKDQPFIGELITLQLHFNPGAAFSSLINATWIITILAALVSAALLFFVRKVESYRWAIALGLLLGGALGNLLDRLIREPGFATGHVVDFLNYSGFFIGNLADVWITIAAVAVFWLTYTGHPYRSTLAEAEPSGDHDE